MLKICALVIGSLSVQIAFWTILKIIRVGSNVEVGYVLTTSILSGFYLILAVFIAKKKKWAHTTALIFIGFSTVTAVRGFFQGFYAGNPGHLILVATYIVSLALLLLPSVRSSFSWPPNV
jgi:hypothetical protein